MTIRLLLTASFTCAALVAAGSAMAGSPHERYAYLGLGTGFSSLENDRAEVDNFIESGARHFSIDDNDNAWKGFAGYQFNRYVAAEIFYADLGRVQLRGRDGGSADLDSTAYGASLVGQLPVTSWFTPSPRSGRPVGTRRSPAT